MISRNKPQPRGPRRVVVSLVMEGELLAALDEKSKAMDMNRSQLIRKIVRKDLNKETVGV